MSVVLRNCVSQCRLYPEGADRIFKYFWKGDINWWASGYWNCTFFWLLPVGPPSLPLRTNRKPLDSLARIASDNENIGPGFLASTTVIFDLICGSLAGDEDAVTALAHGMLHLGGQSNLALQGDCLEMMDEQAG